MNGLLAAAALILGMHPVTAASDDASRLPPEYACHARYIRLDDVSQERRADIIRVLALHVNQLSQASEVVPPWIVPGTNLTLVRIHALDYGEQFAKTYEKLQSPWDSQLIKEIFYETEYQWYGYVDRATGKNVYTEKKPIGKKAVGKNRRSAPAFWLTDTPQLQAQYAVLAQRTQTSVPIVRATWFIAHTLAQADRSPTGYYDFLGIRSERDFQSLGDFDDKRKRRRTEYREAVAISSVTLQPRALERLDGNGTAYWRSFDFRLAVNERNPLQVFGRTIEDVFRDPNNVKDVASEQYIGLPNDLWATAAFNNKGEPQDSAPDFAASDGKSTSNDRRVHVGISCIRCHKSGGLQSINGWVRNFFPPPLELTLPTIDEIRLHRQQYGRDLAGRIDDDRRTYSRVVKRWTGWTSEEYAEQIAKVWYDYEDAPVNTDRLAALLNTTPERLRVAIDATVKASNADRILSAIVIAGQSVPIRQAEERAVVAHMALRGLQPSTQEYPK